MEGCMSNLVKYLLFFTNFLVFVFGVIVFGVGIWVLADKPSFLTSFDEASKAAGDVDFNIEIYTSAAYIFLIVSALIIVLAFFGCCGAWKENKCMLGTYFVLILAMFILMIIGAVLAYSGNLETTIKDPLKKALEKYDDSADETTPEGAYKGAWNEVQKELKCCGVDNVKDWSEGSHNWTPSGVNKPAGCCFYNRKNGEEMSEDDKEACRKDPLDPESTDYYFDGCFTIMKNQIEGNQNTFVYVGVGVIVVMFLNMLSSFAMCTMVN